jgi:hypothetical protein
MSQPKPVDEHVAYLGLQCVLVFWIANEAALPGAAND